MTLMAAEIAETGAAIRRQLEANARAATGPCGGTAGRPATFVATIARGSSDHAALFLKHVVELKVGLACASLGPSIASLYRAPLRLERAVAVTISQSGRSPDILAMQQAAKQAGATTIALVNDADVARRARRGRAPAAACGRRTVGRRHQVDDRVAGRRPVACRALERRRGRRRRARPPARDSRSLATTPPPDEAVDDAGEDRAPSMSSGAARPSPSPPRPRSS